MRKSAWLAIGAGAAVVTLAVVLDRPSSAQQAGPPKPPTSVVLAAGDTATLPGPRQPVFFRHDIHAGQYQISCQYCHYSASVSTEPGVPSMQTCMGCHLVVSGSDSANQNEIRKVRDAWGKKAPIEWVRVHFVARHVHFPHQNHVKAMGPTACAACHGDVARMPQVFKVNNVNNMGWCINCHLARGVKRDCTICHH